MAWSSLRDADPRNAGPVGIIAAVLFVVLLLSVVGVVWLAFERDAEKRRCRDQVPGADLSGCDLSSTRMAERDLSGADLSGADLTDVNLSDTDLSGADLSGADLTKANLAGADLTNAELVGVVWDRTTCPDGQVTATGVAC